MDKLLYNIKWFFKNRVRRGSFVWNTLLAVRRSFERVRRVKSCLWQFTLPFAKIDDVNRFDAKIYSQNGEDGILEAIFRKIGTTNKFCVEFGVKNGSERNTRFLCERRGWTALLMDPADNNPSWIKKEFITAQNINEVFKKYEVPENFDLLSIDIDGNDYWIWKALDARYVPRVVVIEYNGKIPPTESQTITYNPDFRWDGTDYYGASLLALVKLATQKGHTLVGCDRQGVNAFFVKSEEVDKHFIKKGIEHRYRPPRFGKKSDRGGRPSSPRRMIPV